MEFLPCSPCPICCEEKPALAMRVLSKCSHQSCNECITTWLEKEESTGQTNLPTCPFCRLHLTEQEAFALLGRPFQPRVASLNEVNLEEIDELTLAWLHEQTKSCPSCGARIEKLDGGCDLMECLCGYRFCYSCGSKGAECFCTPSHHYYWDNILNRSAGRSAPEQAPADEDTGMVDLKNHIQGRIKREQRRAKREEDARVLDAVVEDVRFLFLTDQAKARVLEQSARAAQVKLDRMLKNLHRRNCCTRNDDAVIADIRVLFVDEKEKAKHVALMEKHERGKRRRRNKRRLQARREHYADAALQDLHYLFESG